MKERPPYWADQFLQWYCDPDTFEDIQGDLYELYQHRLTTLGKRSADLIFIWEVFLLLRLCLLRNPFRKEKKICLLIEEDGSASQVRVLTLEPWNDILFESRNKDYGAYRIRNAYGKSMLFGFGFVTLIAMSIVLWWWIEFMV